VKKIIRVQMASFFTGHFRSEDESFDAGSIVASNYRSCEIGPQAFLVDLLRSDIDLLRRDT